MLITSCGWLRTLGLYTLVENILGQPVRLLVFLTNLILDNCVLCTRVHVNAVSGYYPFLVCFLNTLTNHDV